MRNALTLGAQDPSATISGIYRRLVTPTLSSAWVGGVTPSVAAIPQFLALGPLYHVFLTKTGSMGISVCLSGISETLITFGSQCRNAERAFNAKTNDVGRHVPVSSPIKFGGPGFVPHILRNIVALSGVRVLSPILHNTFDEDYSNSKSPASSGKDTRVSSGGSRGDPPRAPFFRTLHMSKFLCDFSCSVMSGILSMPLHHAFNISVTSIELRNSGFSSSERRAFVLRKTREQYFQTNENGVTTIRRTLLRDMVLRGSYAGCVFSTFLLIERALVTLWPTH